MDTIKLCPSCGKPLAANAPKGLCPECLMKGAFPSDPAPGGPPRPHWTPPPPAELQPHFPQLEILELIGAGGMGAVYKALQKKLDRPVALKILPLETAHDPAFAERFAREARALARLNHPNIVTVYDFGQSGPFYYFIMEFVEGANLRQLIQDKTLEPRQALELVMQICTALQFAHDEKIVHRDIKPENILVDKKGRVKIADFGLAKLMGATPDTGLTASQMTMGTINYMAPEQRENSRDVDHRADIYSLGVVFYEMLTGQVPMGRFDPPSKKVQVDVRLDEVVLHALEREPERRYQQVSEIKSNVETIASSAPKSEPKSPPQETPPPSVVYAKKITKGEFMGIGAVVQATGLALLFIPYCLLLGIVVLLIGGRMALKSVCSKCGKKVGHEAQICPHCAASFHNPPKVARPQQTPKFVPFVLKRFAIFAGVWLATALFVRGALGDATLGVPSSAPFLTQLGHGLLVLIIAPFTLSWAEFILPAGFAIIVGMWLEAREKRGLSSRQFPPRTRRQHLLWAIASAALYLAAVTGTIFALISTGALQKDIDRDYRTRAAEATQWWFTPHARNFEKLGFQLKFSREPGNGQGAYASLPACTVALTVKRTNAQPAVMTVVLPGLRSNYRIPLTNNWAYDVVLDKENLIDWLRKGAGLDPAAPKFNEQADEIYGLLKTYQTLPPETVMEFVNLDKAALTDFWFAGDEMSGFTFGGVTSETPLWIWIGLESALYAVAAWWLMRKTYREGWAEIESGRWTPPPLPLPSQRFPTSIKFLIWFSFVPLAIATLAWAERGAALGILISWTIILGSAFSFQSRQQIREARARGLWPALGELPTLDHVQRLAQAGEKILAIRLYRQIHHVSLADGKAAVEKLGLK
jgi:predicted Ser/Thr protein kinase